MCPFHQLYHFSNCNTADAITPYISNRLFRLCANVTACLFEFTCESNIGISESTFMMEYIKGYWKLMLLESALIHRISELPCLADIIRPKFRYMQALVTFVTYHNSLNSACYNRIFISSYVAAIYVVDLTLSKIIKL